MTTVGIDATNLRRGGGVTHLVELLSAAEPGEHGIKKIVVWGGEQTLTRLPDRRWLDKISPPPLNKGVLRRIWWQRFNLANEARACRCDVLFVPGGSYAGNFRPIVTMSRNLLPFEWRELRRYGWSPAALKLALLRYVQSRSCRRADGVIFLTQYAKMTVQSVTGKLDGEIATIPHGLNSRFRLSPKKQGAIEEYSESSPFRLLYVSIVEPYKHQWHLVEAIHALRLDGFPIRLELVGPANPVALSRLQTAIKKFDPEGVSVHYHGAVPYEALHQIYEQADLGVFASSCENMPNILLETMAAGLPVACSNRGPMPEVLGEAGLYFDPEDPAGIARAIRKYILSPELRKDMAGASFERCRQYSWEQCAGQTLDFLAGIAQRRRK